MKIWTQKELVQAHGDQVGSESSRSSTLLKFVGTIHQCERMKWIIPRVNVRVVGPKHMFHIGYEPAHLFNLVGPKVYALTMVIKGVYLLGRNSLEFFLVPTEQIQDVVYSLKVYPLPKGYTRVTGRVMAQ